MKIINPKSITIINQEKAEKEMTEENNAEVLLTLAEQDGRIESNENDIAELLLAISEE